MKKDKWETERTIGTNEYRILNYAWHQLATFQPEKVFFFGSFATPSFKPGQSDIDLCVVARTENKRETIAELYNCIDLDLPCDLILYTPEEWARCVQDQSSFAYHISATGMMLVNKLNVTAVPGPPLISKGEDKLKRFIDKTKSKNIRNNKKTKGVKMIILEETYGETYKLLSAITCPEGKDSDECDGINKKGYLNCWDCKAKALGIDIKFAEMKRDSYHK